MGAHHSVPRGRRALVTLTTGERFVAKFAEQRGRLVEFFDHRPVPLGKIRFVTFYRPQPRKGVSHDDTR